MNKQQFKEKLINKMVFILKLKDKNTIENLNTLDLDDITLLYTKFLPIPDNLQQCNSHFVWIKRHCKVVIKAESECSSLLHKLQESYKKFIKETGVKNTNDFNQEQLEKYKYFIESIDYVEKDLKHYQDDIVYLNNKLEYICDYYDKIDLPLLEFASLCGVNYIDAKLNTEKYDKEDRCRDHRHWSYLFHGIENAHEEEGWKSNRNGMPLMDLAFQNFLIIMDRNKEIKDKVDNYMMHTMGLAGSMMTLKEDEEGNQTLEKYYPPLKVIE